MRIGALSGGQVLAMVAMASAAKLTSNSALVVFTGSDNNGYTRKVPIYSGSDASDPGPILHAGKSDARGGFGVGAWPANECLWS